MFGKMNEKEIDQLLQRQLVGRIGCHSDGVTYVVPVSYAYDGECIYVHSVEGMKLNIMRKNPHICFQVEDTKNLANWQSVICWGDFEELTIKEDIAHALSRLDSRILPRFSSETMHITPEWPFAPSGNEAILGVFFRVKLIEKTGRFEKTSAEAFFTM
jgi:uncharacterized protein